MAASIITRSAYLALAGIGFSAAQAEACSMVRGYRVPTNLELAAQADAIVVATVDGDRKAERMFEGAVFATPYLLLKGDRLPPRITLGGAVLASADMPAAASDPRELRAPNPDALIGGCVRYIFAKGTKLLLFLKRAESGELSPLRSAFSRDAEDVSGEDALWVKAIREYATIGKAPKNEWKSRLRARIAELRAQAGAPDAAALAADMAVELSGRRLPPYD